MGREFKTDQNSLDNSQINPKVWSTKGPLKAPLLWPRVMKSGNFFPFIIKGSWNNQDLFQQSVQREFSKEKRAPSSFLTTRRSSNLFLLGKAAGKSQKKKKKKSHLWCKLADFVLQPLDALISGRLWEHYPGFSLYNSQFFILHFPVSHFPPPSPSFQTWLWRTLRKMRGHSGKGGDIEVKMGILRGKGGDIEGKGGH